VAGKCLERSYACLDVNSHSPAETVATRGPAVADYPVGARMALRVIDDFEFVWMLRGRARFIADDQEVVLTPGLLLLVPPGPRHRFTWDERRPSRHGYVHFLPARPPGGARARWRRMTEVDPMSGLCAYLVWLGRERPEGWEPGVRQTLDVLLDVFTSGPLPGDAAASVLPAHLAAVVDHLRAVWSDMPLRRVGIGELAAAAHVSRSYLNRSFHREFGTGAASALERLRCSRAEPLLTRTDMTVGAIAKQCGFADLYHFSHRFSRRYGVPPSVYRDAGIPTFSVLDDPGVRRLAHAVWG
jgi:AraC family transcriptional regulator